MTGEIVLFWLFALLTCAGAISVAASQSVVRMAFSLVLTLGSTAVLFLLLGADFVGATQLLVYVGGTLVLLVFGVMLTATGPLTRIKSSPADAILSGLIGVVFLFIVASTVVAVDWSGDLGVADKVNLGTHAKAVPGGFNHPQQGNTTRPLGLSFLSLRTDRDLRFESQPASSTNITPVIPGESGVAAVVPVPSSAAPPPSPGYLLPFEIVSVHLLVVLVGAAYLARTKRRAPTVS
jgi:NADH:ubiquinone oxidoreductase subunit 6 (subunit J)